MVLTVYDDVNITHTHTLEGLSKLNCSTTKRTSIANDASSESSPRYVFNTSLLGTGTLPQLVWTYFTSSMENRPGVIKYTVVRDLSDRQRKETFILTQRLQMYPNLVSDRKHKGSRYASFLFEEIKFDNFRLP